MCCFHRCPSVPHNYGKDDKARMSKFPLDGCRTQGMLGGIGRLQRLQRTVGPTLVDSDPICKVLFNSLIVHEYSAYRAACQVFRRVPQRAG
jgi:hypothetical protein